jgi:PTS system galactitol-specific IIB component
VTTGKPKTILVACGRAVATSTVVAEAIKNALLEQGIEVTTIPCRVSEIPELAVKADLVISTTPVSAKLDIPVIVTLAFLTGMGKERVINQIITLISQN